MVSVPHVIFPAMRQENGAWIRIHSTQLQHAVEYFLSPRIHVGDGWQVRCGRWPNAATIRMAELTNMACHESPTREPRGLDGAWGPARWARSRGRNGVAYRA